MNLRTNKIKASDLIYAMGTLPELLVWRSKTIRNAVVGITLNSSYIKILKINYLVTPCQVEHFAILPTPVGAVVNDEVKDPKTIAILLRKLFKDAGIKTKNVALCISRSSVIVKNITVDSRLTADEVESRVWIEANRLFPNLIGDIYLDFAVVGPSSADSTQSEVTIIACRKEHMNPLIETVTQAGLTPRNIDINSYALMRAFSLIAIRTPETKNFALINITFSLIDLIVISEGKLVYTHERSYNGSDILEELEELRARKMDESPNDVDVLSKPSVIIDILKSKLSLHIRHVMQFFYTSRPNVRVEELFLSGDCAATIPEFADFIFQEVGKKIIMANPFERMKINDQIDQKQLNQFAPAFMLCSGLALTKMDNHTS